MRKVLRLYLEPDGKLNTLVEQGAVWETHVMNVKATGAPLEEASRALQAVGERPETVVEVWDRVRPYGRYRAVLGDLWGYFSWPRPPGTEEPLPDMP